MNFTNPKIMLQYPLLYTASCDLVYFFFFFFFLLPKSRTIKLHRGQNHCWSSGGSTLMPTHGLHTRSTTLTADINITPYQCVFNGNLAQHLPVIPVVTIIAANHRTAVIGQFACGTYPNLLSIFSSNNTDSFCDDDTLVGCTSAQLTGR